jgi:hypothetical protein
MATTAFIWFENVMDEGIARTDRMKRRGTARTFTRTIGLATTAEELSLVTWSAFVAFLCSSIRSVMASDTVPTGRTRPSADAKIRCSSSIATPIGYRERKKKEMMEESSAYHEISSAIDSPTVDRPMTNTQR